VRSKIETIEKAGLAGSWVALRLVTPEAIGELLVATGRRGIYGVVRFLAYITGSVDQELLLRNSTLPPKIES